MFSCVTLFFLPFFSPSATSFLQRVGASGGGAGLGDRDTGGGGRDGGDVEGGRKRMRDDFDYDDEPRWRAFDHHHAPPPHGAHPAHGTHHHQGSGGSSGSSSDGYPEGPSSRGPPPPGGPGVGDGRRPGSFVQDHDDATPSLLIRNLPPDVKIDELVTLIIKVR